MDLSGPCPGLAITVMTLLPSLDEILRPPKLGLFLLLPSTKEVVRGREELIAAAGYDDEHDGECRRCYLEGVLLCLSSHFSTFGQLFLL